MKHSRILIIGYYGFKNLGDELMLQHIISKLRELDPEVKITAYSNNPAETMRLYGIDAVPFYYKGSLNQYIGHVKNILSSDVVIWGGGTFMQDYGVYGSSGIGYYLKLMIMARLFGKKTLIIGAGAGPLTTLCGKHISRLFVSLSQETVVRDADSFNLLRKIGCSGKRLIQGADLTFASNEIVPLTNKTGKNEEGKKHAGVSFLSFYGHVYRDAGREEKFRIEAALFVEGLLQRGYEVDFFVLQEDIDGGDNEFALDIKKRLGGRLNIVGFGLDGAKFFERLAKMDFVFGMRYHCMILSMLSGVPVFGLSYNPKVESLFRETGIPERCIRVEDFMSSSALKLIDNGAKYDISAGLSNMKKLSHNNFDALEKLIGAKG